MHFQITFILLLLYDVWSVLLLALPSVNRLAYRIFVIGLPNLRVLCLHKNVYFPAIISIIKRVLVLLIRQYVFCVIAETGMKWESVYSVQPNLPSSDDPSV